MKYPSRRFNVALCLSVIGVLFAVPKNAQAAVLAALTGLFGLGEVAAFVIGKIVWVFNYIVGYLAGILLWWFSWLVDVALRLNKLILEDTGSIVHVGWGITRDLANLGFVLVIIIIAFGIMFRVEKYGSQKLLVRLIAAAILVNFSLTIAGVFLQFSHVLTEFFLSRIPHTSLGSSIAGAFDVQRFLDTPENFETVTERASTFSSSLLASIASLFFSIAFSFIAIVVVGTFSLMLFVRYLWLVFLLILAPLAWLFWVVPNLASHFTMWWNHFMKWTFFAPAASFFIYLSFVAVENLNGTSSAVLDSGNFFSATFTTVLSQGAQMVVIAGIMLGGLIAAQKIGIESANIGLNLANKAKAGALGWAGRKSVQATSAFFRRKGTEEGAKSRAEKIQSWAENRKSFIGRYAAGWVARGTATLSTAGGEDQVKYHGSQVKGMSEAEAKAALLTATGPRKIALVNKLREDGKLGDVDMTRIATEDNKKLFLSFGQGKAFGDAEKAGLMSVEMAKAIKEGNQTALATATDELVQKMTRKDMANAAVKDLFSGKAKFGLDQASVQNLSEHFSRAVIAENPTLTPSIIPKLDKKSLDNFSDTYERELNDALRIATPGSPAHDQLTKSKDQFQKILANYALGFTPTEGGAPAATPAPAPTPSPAPGPATP